MSSLLSYAAQVIVASGLFYGYYHFALRNQRFHRYNRYFIIAAVMLSFMVPLLQIPVYFTREAAASPIMITLNDLGSPLRSAESFKMVSSADQVNYFPILIYGFYAVVVLILLVRIIISLRYLYGLSRKYSVHKMQQIRFVNTTEPGTPFSFFNWMFWDQRLDPLSFRGKQVFRHEMFHITQWHSLDILFMQLVNMVGWLNPFFHLFKNELRAIHEFLADEYAVKDSDNTSYAELLLVRVMGTNHEIVNPFFNNQVKRRIIMLLNKNETGRAYLRKIAVLPIIMVSFLLFAFTYHRIENPVSAENRNVLLIKENPVTDVKEVNLNTVKSDTAKPNPSISISSLPEKLLVVIDNKRKMEIRAKDKDTLDKIVSPSQIRSITILKGEAAEKKYGKDWKDGVIEIYTKEMQEVELREVVVDGKTIPDKKNVVIVDGNRLEADSIVVVTDHKREPVVIVDGQRLEPAVADDENKIFARVEIEAAFPGGAEAFRRFIDKNLKKNIGKEKGAPNGQYTVVLQFIVHLDGSISDIVPLTKFGYGMEEEAVRVLKLSPSWLPAIQNGKKVVAYRKQPFNFF